MRAVLTAACVLAAGLASAADKPKKAAESKFVVAKPVVADTPLPAGVLSVAGEVFWNVWDSLFPLPPVPSEDVVETPRPTPGTRPDVLSSRGGRIHPNLDVPLPVIPVPHTIRTVGYAGPIPGAATGPKAEVKREELLHQEFDSWQPGEPRPTVFDLTPKFTTPQRIHGGIMKADPPKPEDLRAISETYKK